MNDAPSIQPSSEGCAGFRPDTRDGWSTHGLCVLPGSDRRGQPVRPGTECACYTARTAAGLDAPSSLAGRTTGGTLPGT